MGSKLNQLLQQWPPATVATLRWLSSLGVDRRLADKYVQSGWLQRLSHGAYKRAGATVDWAGAVHALQTQLGVAVHPGGISAIELRGYAHYLAFGTREVVLFGHPGTKLPAWFEAHSWSRPVTSAWSSPRACWKTPYSAGGWTTSKSLAVPSALPLRNWTVGNPPT